MLGSLEAEPVDALQDGLITGRIDDRAALCLEGKLGSGLCEQHGPYGTDHQERQSLARVWGVVVLLPALAYARHRLEWQTGDL